LPSLSIPSPPSLPIVPASCNFILQQRDMTSDQHGEPLVAPTTFSHRDSNYSSTANHTQGYQNSAYGPRRASSFPKSCLKPSTQRGTRYDESQPADEHHTPMATPQVSRYRSDPPSSSNNSTVAPPTKTPDNTDNTKWWQDTVDSLTRQLSEQIVSKTASDQEWQRKLAVAETRLLIASSERAGSRREAALLKRRLRERNAFQPTLYSKKPSSFEVKSDDDAYSKDKKQKKPWRKDLSQNDHHSQWT
jgi:hypothetical protein